MMYEMYAAVLFVYVIIIAVLSAEKSTVRLKNHEKNS